MQDFTLSALCYGQTEGHTVTWLPNFLRCIDNHIFSAMGPCLHTRRAPLIEIVLSFSPKLFQNCHYKDSHHTRCLSLETRDLSLEMRWVTYTCTCTFEWCCNLQLKYYCNDFVFFYRVARVEQTETPEMMKERCRKSILSISCSFYSFTVYYFNWLLTFIFYSILN